MNEAHEKTRLRQLEDAAAHWEHKYANARQYNRNLEERNQKLEAAIVAAGNRIEEGYPNEALAMLRDAQEHFKADMVLSRATEETPAEQNFAVIRETLDRMDERETGTES